MVYDKTNTEVESNPILRNSRVDLAQLILSPLSESIEKIVLQDGHSETGFYMILREKSH